MSNQRRLSIFGNDSVVLQFRYLTLLLERKCYLSLASDHTNKALSLVTDDVNKEIAERNQRLSDDPNADLAALRTSAESASGNNMASDTDILVEDINGILDEIVTARIDPDQLNNSTIHVLAAVELLDEVLSNYGNAFAVEYDMTNM